MSGAAPQPRHDRLVTLGTFLLLAPFATALLYGLVIGYGL